MPDTRKIKLTRDQLAEFLPSHEAIKEFERLFGRDYEVTVSIENIINGVGLEPDGTYSPDTSANYIDSALSFKDADSILDAQLFNNTRSRVISTSTSITLGEYNQSVLVDATSGTVNITMPNPANCFSDSSSYKFGITKIDATANAVNILPYAGETIAGSAGEFLDLQSEVLNFITNGVNWYLES